MRDEEKMEVKPGFEVAYDVFVSKNQDAYGNSAVLAAAHCGRLLTEGKTPVEAEEIGFKGKDLTGFLAGCAAETVAAYHPRGDEFRIYWNKLNGVSEDKAKGGVVNPAILTIGE